MILKELNIDEVKNYIKSQSPESRVYLGADSERHKINGEWFADYITAAGGGDNALREAAELLIALNGNYDDTIGQRIQYTAKYHEYITARNTPNPSFYTITDAQITEQPNK